jgi:3-hydroxyacyl-CoA dehydrogenase
MNINERFEKVTVLGAAGKMGSGICLLLAREMVRLKHLPENRGRTYQLNLIELRDEALKNLLGYIETQSARHANRTIDAIRPFYQLRTDEEIVAAFVTDVRSLIQTSTDFHQVEDSRLVFEAVPEVERLKIDALKRVNEICNGETFFLSNTSSIPIGFLDREAGLDGRIIGFHFYNPPAIQKLVELIPAQNTQPELTEIAHEIAQRLGKIVVTSKDVAGFIGNGHFVRDALHAVSEIDNLCQDFEEFEAIYALNRVSQDGLLRPMGIFQLLDYVGLDVFSAIMEVMTRHTNESFASALIAKMLSKNLRGGQHPGGSQKDGFFRYSGRQPIGVYASDRNEYIPFESARFERIDRRLGPLGTLKWSELLNTPDLEQKLSTHFAHLAASNTLGARLTMRYLAASKLLGEKLVSDGVAESPEDVDTVLMRGFGHLYGAFQIEN